MNNANAFFNSFEKSQLQENEELSVSILVILIVQKFIFSNDF